VVGAGVFGAWTALRFAEHGDRVTLIDAFGPASGRASSADHSRVIRSGYGADALYSQWAADARHAWDRLAAETGQELLIPTGALFMGDVGNAYVSATYETLRSLGRRAEWLEPADVATRFPQIAIDSGGAALLEPDAGVLRARAAVHAVVTVAQRRAGVEYRAAAIRALDEQRQTPTIQLVDGLHLQADVYVLACGAWLPRLLPDTIGARIRATRQEVLYYGIAAGETRFSVPHCPVWIDFGAGLYGIPDFDSMGFKVGIDRHGPPIDPDASDRIVDPALVEQTRTWITRRFPGLGAAPLVDSRVCQYENTSSGDFIIDRHPLWPSVWIVGGGSGHGFKHGPSIARYLVDLMAGTVAPEARFALATKQTVPQRAVF
jgi:sarcosine oxidase